MTAEVVGWGIRPCKRCGKPHAHYITQLRSGSSSSWADPDDGHPYTPYSWETIAVAFADEHPWPSLEKLAAVDEHLRKLVVA